jgi:ferredoxin
MRIAVLYFTGTGNTEFVAQELSAAFGREHPTELFNIELGAPPTAEFLSGFDLLVFGAPVYGFAIPRPFEMFLRRLTRLPGRRAFLYLTMGGGALAALHHPIAQLRRRGLDVVRATLFQMPSNVFLTGRDDAGYIYRLLWYTETQDPARMLDLCRAHVVREAAAILRNERCIPTSTAPARFACWFGRMTVLTSGWQMRFALHARRQCNQCGICVRSCPQGNIRLSARSVRFGWRCAMCYRCINICPKQAVKLRFPANIFDNRVQYVCPGWKPPAHDRR